MASFISTAETVKPFIVEGGLMKKQCKPRLSYRAMMSSELKQSIWEDSGSCKGTFIHTQEVKNCQAVPYIFIRPSLPSLKRRDSLTCQVPRKPCRELQSSSSVSSHSFCHGLLGTWLTLNHPCFCKLSLTHTPVINSRQLTGAPCWTLVVLFLWSLVGSLSEMSSHSHLCKNTIT